MTAGACPSLADLLLATEGELPPATQRQVSTHLRRCPGCQAMLATTASVMNVVRQVMKPFGETDTGDAAAEARYKRFLEELQMRKQQRIRRSRSASPFRRWLPLAAGLLLAAGFSLATSGTIIQADELVKHAVSVEHARPTGSAGRLRLTPIPANTVALSGGGLPSFTDLEITDGIVVNASTALAPDTEAATLVRRLAQHRFDWRRPLNAAAFDDWRHALAHKQDVVIDRPRSPYVILRVTTPDAGELREVELTVYRDSYRVFSEVFTFDDGSLLTFEELDHWTRRVAPAAAVATRTTAPASGRPARVLDQVIAPATPQPDLARWLEWRFGESPARATFLPELRRLTRSTRQHLGALRELAAHDPDVEGAEFSPAARARFERQLNLQYQSLREDLDTLAPRILVLTLQSDEKRRMPTAASTQMPVDWARRVDAGLTSAATLDRLAGDLRAYDDLPPELRQQVADTFDALLAAIYAPVR